MAARLGLAALQNNVSGNYFLLNSSKRLFVHGTFQRYCRCPFRLISSQRQGHGNVETESLVGEGPSLSHFIAQSHSKKVALNELTSPSGANHFVDDAVPYLAHDSYAGSSRKVYFETYGCQMNVNDMEIALAILEKHGFTQTRNIHEGDVVLVMTCTIREGADQKIWNRLEYLKAMKRRRQLDKSRSPMKIAILGCMAERLKEQILEREQMVDVVCGPDAYRDLPRLLAETDSGQAAVNVVLSLDETYADVMPVRVHSKSKSAFVSIMRGCNNMCTYCIVPFTRGRERSRPVQSILDEVRALSDQGIKEVTLLGQNVNSYCDMSESQHAVSSSHSATADGLARGFRTVYKPKQGGRRFADLLHQVSLIDPEMRIRFTSPHPKDFPDQVLQAIASEVNICNQLHVPAQSGSSRMLEVMRRGYTREAYLDLIHHIRNILPGVSLSSDFIAGFCGETEADHQLTVDLIHQVKYDFAFCFPYSMRQKTKAYHRLKDDVDDAVKLRRHNELISAFRNEAAKLHADQIGQVHLVLVEGDSKRSSEELAGRNDGNTKVIFPKVPLPAEGQSDCLAPVHIGDYVAVKITGGTSQVLRGLPLYHSSLQTFSSHISHGHNDSSIRVHDPSILAAVPS